MRKILILILLSLCFFSFSFAGRHDEDKRTPRQILQALRRQKPIIPLSLEEHARLLNVKVVKHKYGSDPAAVAFDAIESAKAHSIDVVMIDSAGRQETNKNLMEELRKIVRVAKPDFKVYVGESYSGQSLLNQASEFDKSLGIDGFILTKVDADAKGGTAISLLYCLKKPILFIGTGQEYDKLIPFEPNFIIDRIV